MEFDLRLIVFALNNFIIGKKEFYMQSKRSANPFFAVLRRYCVMKSSQKKAN